MCNFVPKAWESCQSIDHSRKTILTYHNALCLSPQNFAYTLFSVSLRPILTPKLRETEDNAYAKFWGDKQRALWYVMVFSGVVNIERGVL